MGTKGMLYSSRSRPDLTHLVLFDRASILQAGKPIAFPQGEIDPA
jgi:hypothetical protein